MAFHGPFDGASPAAGLVQQGETYNVPVVSMTNSVSVQAICLGIGSFLWVPLASTYGRRPVYMAAAIVGALGQLGCALSNNLGGWVVSRVCRAFAHMGHRPDHYYIRLSTVWVAQLPWPSVGRQ
jgi:MFS family permease